MRTLLFIIIHILVFSCAEKTNSNFSTYQPKISSPKDTIENNIKPDTLLAILQENSHYIGYIKPFYFSNEQEVYIELYFLKDTLSVDEYAKIEKLADSLIYEDDDNSRLGFPKKLSNSYFDLRGLSNLKVYDDNHHFVCNANFIRVEYLNQNISPCFIAVYKTEKKIDSDHYYCISNINTTFEKLNYAIFKDSVFTQKIRQELSLTLPYNAFNEEGTHIRLNNNTTLSIVNSSDYAYIVLKKEGTFKVLYKSKETENITGLTILPLSKNELPYILVRCIAPESDFMWEGLLYYDDNKYTYANRQRMK
ncbi:hypothetical protein [Flavobacterium sp. J27]|uniref:hypothetical protein n=1 Tax=Flavobacterium sp. J27 TaxID=2060419 RepID=UPI0010313BA2|nr:hypothetical protein [Flavobacterium sp. J27]